MWRRSSYATPGSRPFVLVFQVLLWIAALFGATRVSVPLARRRGPLVTDETLITFEDDAPVDGVDPPVGIDPGLDMTGQVARTGLGDESDSPLGDPVDEQSWVDDLMAEAVEDPITVADDNDETPESEDDR